MLAIFFEDLKGKSIIISGFEAVQLLLKKLGNLLENSGYGIARSTTVSVFIETV